MAVYLFRAPLLLTLAVSTCLFFWLLRQPRDAPQSMNRQEVVSRHNIRIHAPAFANLSMLDVFSLGNGAFTFNVDATGSQSFNASYDSIFGTNTFADWGWHSAPPPAGVDPFKDFRFAYLASAGRNKSVPYSLNSKGQCGECYNWLRMNPHRLNLLQLSLQHAPHGCNTSSTLDPAKLSSFDQSLDLWAGVHDASFVLANNSSKPQQVKTRTVVHPDFDVISFTVSFEHEPELGLQLAFPYGSGASKNGADWTKADAHYTNIFYADESTFILNRTLDNDAYVVACRWSGRGWQWHRSASHVFKILPSQAKADSTIQLSCLLAPSDGKYPIGAEDSWLRAKSSSTRAMLASPIQIPLAAETLDAAKVAWKSFWLSGAAVDLASENFEDARALELERRVVLSQYLTAVMSAGATPPQETGLITNSWYGKFHHEMRWWHQAHFALWGRVQLLLRSEAWYLESLKNATSWAAFQGYAGARWPKMTAPVANRSIGNPMDAQEVGPISWPNASGRLLVWDSPSGTGPLLIWEQPHPIWIAELERLVLNETLGHDAALLHEQRMRQLVFETATFMASFAHKNETTGTWWLGPPLKGGDEAESSNSWNPSFELAYWRVCLDIASSWHERAGLGRVALWDDLVAHMAAYPVTHEGLYNFAESCENPFDPSATRGNCPHAHSHPMMAGMYGMINGAKYGVDLERANSTLKMIMKTWQWKRQNGEGSPDVWGWDFPLVALAAVRLSWPPTEVVDMLLMDSPKNVYLRNGHNQQGSGGLPCYLPGNGGLLAAVAMMCTGAVDHLNPGVGALRFPASWSAKCEGFPILYP